MLLPSHFIATPTETGHTWTLPSRLGELLGLAEARFGPRDRTFTILGIECGLGVPHLWYPGDKKDVVVQLGFKAWNDDYLARYQLAHECVHLLSPSGSQRAPVLEEGLAVVFAEDYVGPNSDGKSPTDDPKYSAAASLVRPLLAAHPNVLKHLRSVTPAFNDMTSKQLSAVLPEVDSDVIRRLLLQYYETDVAQIVG